jgi:PTH1 family peptidyl-tRNA hydrolase
VYLIVGLGNPGSEYKNTRHNTGFQVISLWSRDLGVRLANRRFRSRNILTKFKGQEIILFCPSTFMNQSGKSVRACADYYDLHTERVLIVHDDLDLPVGKIKVVRNGGSGGHKGVLSIIEHLGSTKFPRIKIGIGRPRYEEKPEDYVLAPFYIDEMDIIARVLKEAVRACQLFILEGVESVMNQINCQNLINKEEKN